MHTKYCNKCGETKELNNFYKNKATWDGYEYYCKKCKRKDRTKYKTRQSYYFKQWYKKNKKKKATYAKKWAKHNKNKQNAELYFNRIKKKFSITALPCIYCGSRPSKAHHPDYDNALEVVWLCNSCHGRIHSGSLKIVKIEYFITKYNLLAFIDPPADKYKKRKLHALAQERISIQKKKCSSCKTLKDFKDFYKSKRTLDRLCSSCKNCMKTLHDKWITKNRKRWNKYQNNRQRNVN